VDREVVGSNPTPTPLAKISGPKYMGYLHIYPTYTHLPAYSLA
jgi:hypothetical protein